MYTLVKTFEHIRFERVLSAVQWFVLCIALGFYAYFIVSSVINVVLRQELLVASEEHRSYISELETTYLALSVELTSDAAKELGLIEIAPIAYVSVEGSAERLTRAE